MGLDFSPGEENNLKMHSEWLLCTGVGTAPTGQSCCLGDEMPVVPIGTESPCLLHWRISPGGPWVLPGSLWENLWVFSSPEERCVASGNSVLSRAQTKHSRKPISVSHRGKSPTLSSSSLVQRPRSKCSVPLVQSSPVFVTLCPAYSVPGCALAGCAQAHACSLHGCWPRGC